MGKRRRHRRTLGEAPTAVKEPSSAQAAGNSAGSPIMDDNSQGVAALEPGGAARDRDTRAGRSAQPTPRRARRRGFFDVYKRGQGYYTRMGTAVGSAILLLLGANYLYRQLETFYDPEKAWTLYLQIGVPVAFLFLFGLLTYWVAGVNRKAVDFFIATEGEMKKVNWSTRREVIGSTKVVIVTTLFLGALLFAVDTLFMLVFSVIGVLRTAPKLFG